MSEDAFRWVITAGVGLTFLVLLVHSFLVFALFGLVRKIQDEVQPLAEKAARLLEKLRPVTESPEMDTLVPAIRKFRAASEQIGPILDKAGVVIAKAGPAVDQAAKVLATTNRILEDARPRISEISQEVVEIAKEGRQQVERAGELLHEAGDRARHRLEQIDNTVESTVAQVEQIGDSMKRAVLRPVKEMNGLAAGISAAMATLIKKPRKSSVDSATQDEEMFI